MIAPATMRKISSNIVIPPKNSLNIYIDIHIYNIYVKIQTITKNMPKRNVKLVRHFYSCLYHTDAEYIHTRFSGEFSIPG